MSALDLEVRDGRLLDLFDRDTELITVSDQFEFTEGAVWNPAENYLVFSDIAASRMYRLDPPGTISVYREPSNMANGNYYDYVLIRGNVDPFARAGPGPRYRQIAHEGLWALYAKE